MTKAAEYSVQCRLLRSGGPSCTIEQVAWIPEKFASVGNVLKIQDVDGWVVHAVYDRMETKTIQDQSHNAGNIWKATSGPEPRGNK